MKVRSISSFFVVISLMSLFLFGSSAIAADTGDPNDFDESDIEAVMCKYQSKYHYVAVVNDFSSKYITWPSLNCSGAPSYPVDFYTNLTEAQASMLVDNIVYNFYETSQYSYTNISWYFLESLPDGEKAYSYATITRPDSSDTWQSRLVQVSSDIDKLAHYNVGSATLVDYVELYGYGRDDPNKTGSTTYCDLVVHENALFADANDLAVANWKETNICGAVGVATVSTQSHYEGTFCTDMTYSYDNYTAYARAISAKLRKDLSRHDGDARSYIKLTDSQQSQSCGYYYATDGIADFNPVGVVYGPNEVFYEWDAPTVGEVWTSDYLFDPCGIPSISAPSRMTYEYGDPNDSYYYSKRDEKAWFFSQSLIVVDPNFADETDPIQSCGAPTKKVYKDNDPNIVYSAGIGCGSSTGETVRGRIIFSDYEPGMKVEVKLNNIFSRKKARLAIGSEYQYTVIDPCDIDRIYCFYPTQEPNEPNYVPFSITAFTGEDQVSFAATSVYTEAAGTSASDPNESQRITAYRSEAENFVFQISTNSYECCNRPESLTEENNIPSITKHENGDIELYYLDVDESYIYKPGFADYSISNFTPADANDTNDYIQLSYSNTARYVYSIDSDWNQAGVSSSASFAFEVDSAGNILSMAEYDEHGRLSKVRDADDPDNFYKEYHYDDPGNFYRVTSYTEYAGGISRTYTLVYDDATGKISGTIGGTSSGCSSCATSGKSRLYTYNDFGEVLTESNAEGTLLYEYEYDNKNRPVAKWIGAKEDVEPVQINVYDTFVASDFGGSEILDTYNYIDGLNYRLTRKVFDGNGQIIINIEFDDLNIDSSTISSDPNVIIASGGKITTYEYDYSGTILNSVSVRSPAFNEGAINTYNKTTLNNSSNTNEDNILVTVDETGMTETVTSRSQYSTYTLNGVTARRVYKSYDQSGLDKGIYTLYSYNGTNGMVESMTQPGTYQLNGDYTKLQTSYTFYSDGRTDTENVSNDGSIDSMVITTYLYNSMNYLAGTETRDYYGNLLSNTINGTNGFGNIVYSIDNAGVAKGKEYDTQGKLISDFVFADPNDTALFANSTTQDISNVYAGLVVSSQTRRVYDTLGRLKEVKIAIADDVFLYDTPDAWYVTSYYYDIYGRMYQKVENATVYPIITTYEYNNLGELEKTNYPEGKWKKQIRNGRGLVTKIIMGYGPEDTNPNDFVVTETVYDSDGNVLKKIKAGEVITSFELDSQGRVFRKYQGDYETEHCDYVEYSRDKYGNIRNQKTVDVDDAGLGTCISKTSSRYNVLGQLIEQTVVADPNTADGMTDRVKLISYDENGRQIESVTKADGNNLSYTNSNEDRVEYQAGDKVEQNWYDVVGNLIYSLKFEYSGYGTTYYNLPFGSIDDAFRYSKESKEVSISRNDYLDGRVEARQILSGFDESNPNYDNSNYPEAGLIWKKLIKYEYDKTGKTSKVIDADNNYITFSYNSRGQQTKQTLWQGKPVLRLNVGTYDPNSFTAYPLRISMTSFNEAGNKSRTATLNDPNILIDISSVNLSRDKVTDYVYDIYGRIYRQRDYYDGINRKVALKEYTYDGLGRIDTIEYADLEEVFLNGSLLFENKQVQKSVSYHYNSKGQKDQETITNINTSTLGASSVITYFDYNSQGQLDEIRNAQGITYQCVYDALGRKIEETDAVGKVIKYYYNSVGDLITKNEDPAGLGRETGYGYDRFGRQTVITSSNDQTNYGYNWQDQVTDVNYPDSDLNFDYDMQGNVIRRRVTKNSQTTTTQYKRDALGRVSYKQYFDGTEWTEPNNSLPFDEILYDALGNKCIMASIDGQSDLELNLYVFNGFGKMTNTAESSSGFSSSVSYGYDQRGLLTAIVYPNEKIVIYNRDALGRIRTVSYDGKEIVSYDYLGEQVIGKTMADVDIEYSASIDTLGRITGETYSNISDSQTLISNTYDYTIHSNRMDERNSTSYGFDTLGKLTSDGSTSYTSDVLGNPTNASDDGLTYTMDNEDRITKVEDAVGTLADYDYDRLGRRSRKVVNSIATNFIYDTMGNVIAEYETDTTDPNSTAWTRDYVYGAGREPVYMQLPRTATMNQATIDFWDFIVGFADAWLCAPNCTVTQLAYDCNTPGDPNAIQNQVNLSDWYCNVSQYDVSDAFNNNGRYLLTDLRNSVVAIADIDSIVEISYDAWGTPSYSGDLEGLSILWNGYYFDSETDNYYLRNRYYSPLERRFLTEDPRGIHPDENWKNQFGVLDRYADALGLYVYCNGDPLNYSDYWGLYSPPWSPYPGSGFYPGYGDDYGGEDTDGIDTPQWCYYLKWYLKWLSGLGQNTDTYDEDDDATTIVREMAGVDQARGKFISQNKRSDGKMNRSFNNIKKYSGGHGWVNSNANYIWDVGDSNIERFLGSYTVKIYPVVKESGKFIRCPVRQVVMVYNVTSFKSGVGSLLPFQWEKECKCGDTVGLPMSNVRQYFIWKEDLYYEGGDDDKKD